MIGYDTLWTMVLSDIFLRRCENYHSTPILIFNFIMIFIFITIVNFFLVLIILIILIFMFMLNLVFIPFLIILIIFIPTNICLQWHSFYTGPTAEPSRSILWFVSRSVMSFTIFSMFIIHLPTNLSLLFPNCFNLFLSASTFSYLSLLFPNCL